MNKPTEMSTLFSVMEKLRLKRYDNEFLITPEGFDAGKGKVYLPEDLKIIKTYRFEGDSNPDDSSALYLIEANDGLIGYTIDVYGAQSNHENDGYDEFIKQIPVEHKEADFLLD